jgi:hypothetical protein
MTRSAVLALVLLAAPLAAVAQPDPPDPPTLPGSVVRADVRVILQGAYASGLPGGAVMRSDIEDELPLAQPFGTAPWNYAGPEAIPATDVGPANGRPDLLDANAVVDWVLVCARTAPAAANTACTASLLRADGSLLDVQTASATARLTPLASGSYHLIVYHRSHIPVMTAAALALGSVAGAPVDLTSNAGALFGTNAAVSLGGGLLGLYGGDGTGDGTVLADDRQAIWLPAVGQQGYLGADFNLDGSVLADDRQAVWLPNVGVQSQVPSALRSTATPTEE